MRHTWMDSVRGVAILLIILLHAAALPELMVGVGQPQWVHDVNTFFVPFRMPTLVLLSGMLLERSLAKPLPLYYLSKVRALVWPYLVWATIYWIVSGQDGWLHWQGWIATSWLWFIFYLAVYYAVAPLVRKVPPVLVFAACWLGSVFAPNGAWTELLFYGGFFFAGHAIWSARERLRRFDTLDYALAAAIIGLSFSVVHLIESHGRVLALPLHRDWLVFVPFTLAGMMAILFFARLIPDAWTAGLRYIGRNSVIFYVLHYPIQLIILRVLSENWIWDWWIYLLLGIAVPLALGLVLASLRYRVPLIDAFFVMPTFRRGPRKSDRHPHESGYMTTARKSSPLP